MNNTAAFTICANNYLAHAKTLAVSFKQHHPNIQFYICLLDKVCDEVDYDSLGADKVVMVDALLPDDINGLAEIYNITEICTVVKPEIIKFLFSEKFDQVIYLDPDIVVFSYFEEVFEGLKQNDIVLTPHICSPTPTGVKPSDNTLLRTGVYNLGFAAFKKSNESLRFIEWWDNKVKLFGFHAPEKGYFFDQIWLMYAPAFLDRVLILRHLGYNAANWNLHEREMSIDGQYLINNSVPLRFFHFSHFKIDSLPSLASYNESYTLNSRPDIEAIFNFYVEKLIEHNYHELKNIPYKYGKRPSEDEQKKNRKKNSRFMVSAYFIKRAFKALMGIN